jgi:hypothetical protein
VDLVSPNELSPRDTYNLLARGTSLRIDGQGGQSVDVSLKGSSNALKQTVEAAKEYGIDITALGYLTFVLDVWTYLTNHNLNRLMNESEVKPERASG